MMPPRHLALFTAVLSSATASLYNLSGPLLPPPSPSTCQPPIDDTSPSFHPWSQAPYCLRTSPSPDPPINSSVYCVYTSPSTSSSTSQFFPSDQSTSLITTPQLASSIISSLVNTTYSPFQPPPRSSLPPAYEVVPVKGKGLGLVATRELKRGEVFMVEYPALLLDVEFLKDVKPHHRRRLVRRGVERLGGGRKGSVEGLDFKGKGKGAGEEGKMDAGRLVDEILGVNAVRVEVEEGREMMGLWTEFSRINHDCQPNALYRFSPKTLALEVFPYRTIDPGEEITVSYTPTSMPRDERHSYLAQIWGFTCSCALCRSSASPSVVSDSDHRRERVVELRQSVVEASSNQYFENALVIAREWLDMAEKEGIPPLMGEWYDVMGRLEFEVGNLEGARRYAMLAIDAWWRFGSGDGTDLEAAREWGRELGRLGRGARLERRGVRNMFGAV